MRASLPAILLLAVVSVALGSIIKDRPTATSIGSDIEVRWHTENEGSVQKFVILRRSGLTGEFVEIADVPPKGDYSTYAYLDRSVFRTTEGIFQYRVRVYTGDTVFSDTDIVTVASHVSSTARRTWGSIKAMFR